MRIFYRITGRRLRVWGDLAPELARLLGIDAGPSGWTAPADVAPDLRAAAQSRRWMLVEVGKK